MYSRIPGTPSTRSGRHSLTLAQATFARPDGALCKDPPVDSTFYDSAQHELGFLVDEYSFRLVTATDEIVRFEAASVVVTATLFAGNTDSLT